ncbi:molybdenum cofactor guanylyltransferase [Spongorhabdus nitratireducens]
MFSAVTGLLLAGGQSSRMGQNKALLSWQGQPLYRHMVQLMRNAGLPQVEISGRLTDDSIPDRYPEQGPLGGIDACVAAGKAGNGLLVVPVDMPLLTSSLLQQLVKEGLQSGKACCYEGSSMPLYIPVDENLEQAIKACFDSPRRRDRSIRAMLQHRGETQRLSAANLSMPLKDMRLSESAPITESVYFKNANTPAEWAECQSAASPSNPVSP